jgi:hypothetical protein
LLTLFGVALPLAGILLGWWSYGFAEIGATPDTVPGGVEYFDETQEMLKGQRYRGRQSARMTFAAGALLLAAAVPMAQAPLHRSDAVNYYALCGYAVVAYCVVFGVYSVRALWLQCREDAFGIFWSKEMWNLYDEAGTRRLFFIANPMPIWTLPDRHWFTKQKRLTPDVLPRKRRLGSVV